MSARDAIIHFNVQLHGLPLDDPIFLAKARQAHLFPLDTDDAIQARHTRSEKSAYFLQHVIEPGAEQYLPKLLKVMKESKVDNLVRLAEDIHTATGIGKINT